MKIEKTLKQVLKELPETWCGPGEIVVRAAKIMGVEFGDPPLTFNHIAGGERFKYMGACCIKLNSHGMAWNCKAEVAMSLLQEAIVTRGWE